MEPNRKRDRVTLASRRRQAGITAIGFVFLAAVFGVVAFAGLKVVPLYLQKLRLSTVLEDVKKEYDANSPTPAGLRRELESRFAVEGLEVPRENVTIEQSRTGGFSVRIHQESRTPFLADLWFVLVFDEQVEIAR